MNDSATYSVVLSGDLKSGFEPERVIEAFARLFKLPPEKASKIVGTEFVVKREVELRVAKSYKDKLGNIGIEVLLKRHGGVDELELEPVQLPESGKPGDGAPLAEGEMICPKCELQQPKAEECSGCGVIIHKALQRAAVADDVPAEATQADGAPTEGKARAPAASGDQGVSLKWLLAPIVVAVLGALLWYLVAIKLDYEFGAVAWLIGGAVGFAAVSSGARGNAIGVICGLLVLVSICGGKYLTVSSQQTQLAQLLSSSIEYEGIDLQEFYQEEMIDAREYMKLPGDDTSLRRFMAAHEYSDFTDAAQITDEELGVFREYTAPRLEEIDRNQPSFEEWRQFNLSNTIEDLSTFDLMVDSLGWIDLLFLFFGIGTAYRLASHGV